MLDIVSSSTLLTFIKAEQRREPWTLEIDTQGLKFIESLTGGGGGAGKSPEDEFLPRTMMETPLQAYPF